MDDTQGSILLALVKKLDEHQFQLRLLSHSAGALRSDTI